jgi:ferritin-like metal-binding protein YciE
MAEDRLNERDARLVQWLNEAYAKEAELEADLAAHIALTEKDSYRKRLQSHLNETQSHKRRVSERIAKLGAEPTTGSSFPVLPTAIGEVAGKAVAAVKGQVGSARAAVTSQDETHVRNAQEELREEHVEIAIYRRIETFATEVGDRETAQLARSIIRDEERMAKFLGDELTRLVKELVRHEIPRDQRSAGAPRSRRTTASTRTAGGRTSASGSATGSRRSGRSSGSRARSAPASGGSRGGRASSNGSGGTSGSTGGRSRRRSQS